MGEACNTYGGDVYGIEDSPPPKRNLKPVYRSGDTVKEEGIILKFILTK